MSTRAEIMEKAQEHRVKFLRLQFTDVFGALKNIAVTVEDLERSLAGELAFDSAAVEGAVENSERDITLLPDPETFVVFPWRPQEGAVARLICDVADPTGDPYPGCSRHVLKKVSQEAASRGLAVQVGAELEFYFFHTDDQGHPTTETHDRAGLCDLSPMDQGENARRDTVLTLEQMGFAIGASHHAAGPGQHEIVLKPDGALATADKLVTLKFAVRTIAQRHSLYASFMPKPLNGMPASSLHFHLSLHRAGQNSLFDPVQPMQLSREAGHFIAGILAHARANSAVTNPIINSYKRLLPGGKAPTSLTWGEDYRASILRVPALRGEGTRIEIRNPDPSCNPYLTLALLLQAGLHGIQQQWEPPPDVSGAEPHLTVNSASPQAASLPLNLEEALRELASDQLARATLGEHIYRRFSAAKLAEWERFQTMVHPWELKEYLPLY